MPEDSPSTHVLRLPAVMKEQPRRARGAKWKPPSTRAGRLGGRLATVARTALCISCLCPTVVPEDDDANTETDYFESAGGGNQAGEEDSRASGSEDSAGELQIHNDNDCMQCRHAVHQALLPEGGSLTERLQPVG